ncbi:hypothetical protein ACQPX6_18370 [Actinomycetospora sp. CA-101289]|uniref:hypothetical protein n=1 Tax=Actinomycetospora sp. CA-101289 TaxID=3239893 RepID=UPI003D9861FF
MSAPHGDGPGAASDAARAAQERLTQEARATASALLDWLGTRVDRGAPADGAPTRPAQSAGPCTWCPVCALVAALRGEQPELTARLAEQASGLMTLLRLMVQAHQEPGHGHDHGHQHAWPPPPGEPVATPSTATRPAPPGWPAEWGAFDGWGSGASHEPEPSSAGAPDPAEPATPPGPTGVPGRRRPPVRRASPRSAAFRGMGVPTTDGDAATTAQDTPAPEPAPARPVRSARAATPPAASGSARPSVQRIAIRRPARHDGAAGSDGPDSSASC